MNAVSIISPKAINELLTKENIFIGVSGHSASGKTTFSQLLCEILPDVKQFPGDMYYKDKSKLRKQFGDNIPGFMKAGQIESPDALSLDKMRSDIIKLKNGQDVYIPSYDFATSTSTPKYEKLKNARIFILDSIHAFDKKIRDLIDLNIFIDTSKQNIFSRYINRAANPPFGFDKQTATELCQNAYENYRPRISQESMDIIVNGNIDPKITAKTFVGIMP